MPINRLATKNKTHGFTLIELVIGIVMLALSFSIISTMILPAAKQSAEQIHQIRAAELGQAMINEILARAFDENSDMIGGKIRCGESGIVCTANNLLGPDGETRANFDDVDDYHGLNSLGINKIENSLGGDMDDIYRDFSIDVQVCNDGDYDGVCFADDGDGDIQTAKLITITVTTAQDYAVTFAVYKANF